MLPARPPSVPGRRHPREPRPPSARGRSAGVATWLLGVLLLATATCTRSLFDDTRPYPEGRLAIRGTEIAVEIPDSPARKHLGLSGRRLLPAGRGMIFPYDPPSRPAFVMRDMRFDLDFVWIRDDRIVDLAEDAPHEVGRVLERYTPREPIDRVLEVPAGTVRRNGWRIGDEVRVLSWPPPAPR